jgi:uncharacterized membrane protein YjjP (DUF1212 family)
MERPDQDIDTVFLVELGEALVRTESAVGEVQDALHAAATGLQRDDLDVLVLPTVLLIQSTRGDRAHIRMGTFRRTPLRFDQTAKVDEIARHTAAGELNSTDARAQLSQAMSSQPPLSLPWRIIGMGVLSAGFSLVLDPSWRALAITFLLGLIVGALRLIRVPALQAMAPILAAFIVAVIVFVLAGHMTLENPLRVAIPPLILFLPGNAFTTATIELASGDTISGASRLIEGLMTLMMLAFGLLAAAAVVKEPTGELLDTPLHHLSLITPVLAIVVLAAGFRLHLCAPWRTLPWVVGVMAVAKGTQLLSALAFPATLSAFFGAFVMTPLIFAAARYRGAPERALFLAGFVMLVPGATGLIGLAQIAIHGVSSGILAAAYAVGAITLGVLLGAATWATSHEGLDRAQALVQRRRASPSS